MANLGALTPITRWVILDGSTPSAGAKLYTYASGGNTPLATYSDADLDISHVHANPVVADADGVLPVIYLQPLAYRFLITDANGVTIFPAQDGVYDFGQLNGALAVNVSLTAGVTFAAGECGYISDGSGALNAGQAYLADADLTYASTEPTIVMATAAVTSGTVGTFRLIGAVTTSGLAAGSSYYVSATAGALTTSAPANARLVGVASSTTQLVMTANPPPADAYDPPQLGWGLSASAAGNALTIALTAADGTTPSTAEPVSLPFRSATVGTGAISTITVTAAETVVIPDTATLATSNNVAFRYWIVAFNDAGAVRLGVINCTTSTSIYPLAGWGIASSTTISTGADSAQVFYSDAGVTSKAYIVLGYVTYESGLATAGTYASAPTRVQVYTPDIALPGRPVQMVTASYAVETTNSTNVAADTGLTASITPTSAANRVLAEVHQAGCDKAAGDAASGVTVVLLRGATTLSTIVTAGGFTNSSLRNVIGTCSSVVLDAPGVATATTYKTTFVNVTNAASVTVQSASAESRILLTELMS